MIIPGDYFTLGNFIAKVDINNETGYQVTLPLQGEKIRIDWGDKHTEIITTATSNYATVSHTYENDGIYYITANISSISHGGCGNSLSLTEVLVSDVNIGNSFCQNCINLTSLSLVGEISSIGSNVCNGCPNLSEINLPDSIQDIGSGFCQNCTNLTSIKLPNQLTYLAYGFCSGCSNLKNIDIPSTITSIDHYVFQNCSNLKIDIIMPNVISVGFSFCKNSGVKRVILNSATNIGDSFCYGCTNLEEVLISPNTSVLPSEFCKGCLKLTNFKIPNNIQTINSSALSETGLYSIEIPNKVTSIGDFFGSRCNNLTSIYIPDSVISIGKTFMFQNSSIAQIRLSNNLENIGKQFCLSAPSLEEIVIPKSVTSIGSDFLFNIHPIIIFEGTTPPEMQHNISNRTIIVPTKESINTYINTSNYPTQTSQYQVNSLSRRIYKVGEKLAWFLTNKNVISEPNEGLTTLANKIDDIYANIPRVIIEDDTVTDFADLRFTVIVPKNCTYIVGYCFQRCQNLKYCILPEGITRIGIAAFEYCDNLKELIMPSTVTTLNDGAMRNIPNLEKLKFKSIIPPTSSSTNTFRNLPTTCIIEVPRESLSAYKSASNYPDPTIYTYGSELFWDENNSNGTNNYTTQILLESGTPATFTTVFDTTQKAYYANITNNGSGMSFIPINVLTGITCDFKLQIDMMSTNLSDSWMALGFAQNEGNGFVYGGYNGYWEGHEYQNNVWMRTLNHNTSSPPTNNTWYILELIKEGTSITINCWDNTHTTNYSSITRTWSNGTNYFGLISDNNTYFKNIRAVYIQDICLSTDKNILSLYHNEQATLTVPYKTGETIELFNADTMEKIGNFTEDNGVYTYSYNATGNGDINLIAKIGSRASNSVLIEDCFLYAPDEISRTSTYTTDHLTEMFNNFSFESNNYVVEADIKFSDASLGFGTAPINTSSLYHHITFGNSYQGGHKLSFYTGKQSSGENIYRYDFINLDTYYNLKYEFSESSVTTYVDNVEKGTYSSLSYMNDETRTLVWQEWDANRTTYAKNVKIKKLISNSSQQDTPSAPIDDPGAIDDG